MPDDFYQADAPPGLEAIALDELRRLAPGLIPARLDHALVEPGMLRFHLDGDPSVLLNSRTIVAIARGRRFEAPRPRALLGDQHLRTLLNMIAFARRLNGPDAFKTLYLSAAGSDSAVLQRLKRQMADATGLRMAEEEGDLQVRLRRPPHGQAGWDVLVRLTPRPLATRPWRVRDMEGALNAAVAHCMALLSRPHRTDTVLNLACGSGTLLIERAVAGRAHRLIGCDTSAEALASARANIRAAGYEDRIALHDWDARHVPLPASSVDALLADLPFGNRVGSHTENLALYPAVLRETARLARPGARFVLITHEARLLEGLLARDPAWQTDSINRIVLRGLHPRVYLLRRRA